MDIPALSMAMSQASISSSVNLSLMKMAMDQMEQNTQQLSEMISDTSVTIDIKI